MPALVGTQIRSIWDCFKPCRSHQKHRSEVTGKNKNFTTASKAPMNADAPTVKSISFHQIIPLWHLHGDLHDTIAPNDFAFVVCPLSFENPNFKHTVYHQFCNNHPQTLCNFISSPPRLQVTPSDHSCCYIISRRAPPRSIVRIERWRVFVVVLLYYMMKLIIHLAFMPFQILFHTVQHWTATVHRRRHWEGR